MSGETHLAVGVAAVVAVTQPKNIREALLAVGVGAVGALISDIDVGSSQSRKEADKIIAIIGLLAVLIFVADHYFNAGIFSRMMASRGVPQIAIGILIFLSVCIFGMEQPHRSFMHSLLGLLLIEISLEIMFPAAVPYFAVGFASHIILDFLNKKRVRILYPLSWGFSLDICSARGLVNKVLLNAGTLFAGYEIVSMLIRFSILKLSMN